LYPFGVIDSRQARSRQVPLTKITNDVFVVLCCVVLCCIVLYCVVR